LLDSLLQERKILRYFNKSLSKVLRAEPNMMKHSTGKDLVEIDGSLMEGGGQILRMSVSLSALFGIPIRISKIRAGRSSPGLKAQHLTGITIVRDLTGGTLTGGHMSSTEITFIPGPIRGGNIAADTKSAGAVCLLAQTAVPCALFAPEPIVLNLRGGTNADMAPQIDEFTEIFLPNFTKFGADFEYEVVKKGFFPKGGGEVNLFVNPVRHINPIDMMDPGKVTSVTGWCFVAGSLPMKVAEQIASSCKRMLKEQNSPALDGVDINIETYKEAAHASHGNGSGIVLVAHTSTGCVMGGSALGSPKKTPEETGKKCANELLEAVESGGCTDKYVQDQLILFMALAAGESRVRTGPITLHTETAIHIAEQLTNAKFSVEDDPNSSSWIIKCKGIGLINPYLAELH